MATHTPPDEQEPQGMHQVPPEPLGRRISWWCLVLLAFAVPLSVGIVPTASGLSPVTYDQFELPKLAVMTALTLIGITTWGFDVLGNGGVVRRTRIWPFVLALLAWTALVTATSIEPLTSLLGSYERFAGLLSLVVYTLTAFLTLQVVTSGSRVRSVLVAVWSSSVIVAAIGVVQHARASWVAQGPVLSSFELARSFSTYGNPVMLGGFLVFPLAMGIGLALATTTPWKRGCFWAGTLVVAACELTTYSRGGWIGALVAVSLMLVAAWRSRTGAVALDYVFVAVGILALLAVATATPAAPGATTNLASRVASIFQPESGSAAQRVEVWRIASRGIRSRPILGYGPDTFARVYSRYRTPAIVNAFGTGSIDNAHDDVLQTAAGSGIPGALLLYGLYFAALWTTAARLFKNEGGSRLLLASVWAACAGYLVSLISGLSLPSSTVFLWMGLAMLLAPDATTRRVTPTEAGKLARWIVVAAGAAGLAVTATWALADVAMLRSQLVNAPAAQRVEMGKRAVATWPIEPAYRVGLGGTYISLATVAAPTERASLKAAGERELTAARRLAPADSENLLMLAHLHNTSPTGTPESRNAYDLAREGLSLDPLNTGLMKEKAGALRALGDLDEAAAALDAALRLDPTDREAVLNLADIYVASGRRQAAEQLCADFLERAPGDAEVAARLAQIRSTE